MTWATWLAPVYACNALDYGLMAIKPLASTWKILFGSKASTKRASSCAVMFVWTKIVNPEIFGHLTMRVCRKNKYLTRKSVEAWAIEIYDYDLWLHCVHFANLEEILSEKEPAIKNKQIFDTARWLIGIVKCHMWSYLSAYRDSAACECLSSVTSGVLYSAANERTGNST